MRDALAERLLANVMRWTPEEDARERPLLQAMAAYKYDEYQKFAPGMRFVESLAVWLSQFTSPIHRKTAYQFVRDKLIFCSSAEMNHLVSIAYPDHIRPLLFQSVAEDLGIEPWRVARIAGSPHFRMRQRQCLFLGLSDGAHIDTFRRYNQRYLGHEQIYQTYEIARERVESLLDELRSGLNSIEGAPPFEGVPKFRTVVLLDDFSASGMSYLRRKDTGDFTGKVYKFFRTLMDLQHPMAQLVDAAQVEIIVVLYLATEQARASLERVAEEVRQAVGATTAWRIVVVYPLASKWRLQSGDGDAINELIDLYYDPAVHDQHMEVGGTVDSKFGFAACGLPLVLSHNTPNNSIALLWSYEDTRVRGLFPRVRRHGTISRMIP